MPPALYCSLKIKQRCERREEECFSCTTERTLWVIGTTASPKKDSKCGTFIRCQKHLHTVIQNDKACFMMHRKGVWLQWEVITELPVMGVSSSSGCADISMATLPSRLDLFRLMETGRFSDSMALTVNSVASKAGSTGMLWHRGSYWSVCPPSPCSDQVQSSSCSHWGGSGMSAPALKWGGKDQWA